MLSIGDNNSMALKVSNNLRQSNAQMGKAMEKLSSGYRINTAADGPADLVESEKLRARIEGLEKAIQNVRTNGNILDVADGALGEVQGIVQKMRKLTLEAQNSGVTSADRIAQNQAEMDAGLQAIDRILNTTNVAGFKLLDNLGLGLGSSPISANNGTLVVRDSVGEEFDRLQSAGNTLDLASYLQNKKDAGELFLESPAKSAFDENGLLLADRKITVRGASGNPEDDVTHTFAAGTGIDEMVAALRQYAFTQEERDQLSDDYVPPADRYTLDPAQLELTLDDVNHLQGLDDEAAAQFLTGSLDSLRNVVFTKAEELDLSKMTEAQRKLYELGQSLQNNMTMNGLGSTEVLKGYDKDGNAIYGAYSLRDLYSGSGASLRENADAAYAVLTQANKDLSAQRAQIAATRKYALEADENLLLSELESYTRAESFLRDQDMASGMVEFTRSKLVSQVGTQMLRAVHDNARQILDVIG